MIKDILQRRQNIVNWIPNIPSSCSWKSRFSAKYSKWSPDKLGIKKNCIQILKTKSYNQNWQTRRRNCFLTFPFLSSYVLYATFSFLVRPPGAFRSELADLFRTLTGKANSESWCLCLCLWQCLYLSEILCLPIVFAEIEGNGLGKFQKICAMFVCWYHF